MNRKLDLSHPAFPAYDGDVLRNIESFPNQTRTLIEDLIADDEIGVRMVDGKRYVSFWSLGPWSAAGSDAADWLLYVDPKHLIVL